MREFCPNCEKETDVIFVSDVGNVDIRGEIIAMYDEYYKCEECGEVFEKPRPGFDPIDGAYREYRRRRGMLQPEEIKRIRLELGLTQKQFGQLVGIGIASVNRYENGDLQSESHDRLIQLTLRTLTPAQIREVKPEYKASD